MELNCEHYRGIIFDNFRRGLTQQQCINELNSIFGDEDPSRTSVYRWYAELNRGRSSLQDEFREDRPKSVVVPETINAVHQLILQNRHVTYREIETTLGISGTNIQKTTRNLSALNRSKKGSCRLVEKMLQKTIVVLRNTSMRS